MQVNRKRLVDLFLQLAKIPSPLWKVGAIMEFLSELIKKEFPEATVIFDEAGKNIEPDKFENGNMLITIPATPGCEELLPVAVDAHVDTVDIPTGLTISPILDGNVIKSDEVTILGADDKSGVAAIIEALRTIREKNLPHGPIQAIFSVGEESSMYGVKALDFTTLAKEILCVDGLESGVVWTACPAKLKYKITVHGKAGHAAFPEGTSNTILIATQAIADAMSQGFFGQSGEYGVIKLATTEKTVWHNIAQITSHPGKPVIFPSTNVVPEKTVICGELRGFEVPILEKYFESLQTCFAKSVSQCQPSKVEYKTERPYLPFAVPKDHPMVVNIITAMKTAGVTKPKTAPMQGSTHANVFSKYGITSVVIGAGCGNPHALDEYLYITDMVNAAKTITNYLSE